MCWGWPSLHSLAAAWNMVAAVGHVVHACQRTSVTYRSEMGGGGTQRVVKYDGRRQDGWKYLYFTGWVENMLLYFELKMEQSTVATKSVLYWNYKDLNNGEKTSWVVGHIKKLNRLTHFAQGRNKMFYLYRYSENSKTLQKATEILRKYNLILATNKGLWNYWNQTNNKTNKQVKTVKCMA